MFNAKIFAKEEKYREEHWAGLQNGLGGGGPNDRPLIVQVTHGPFCVLGKKPKNNNNNNCLLFHLSP